MDLLKSTSSISILLTSYSNIGIFHSYPIQIQYAYISQKKIQSQLGSPKYMYNHCMLCTLHFGLSWVVLYVRTWSFSIASKRAQDHQNRSPDVKVMHVSVLGFLLFFLMAGHPGLGRMSGLPGRPGCPGSSRKSGPQIPEPVFKCWLCPPDVRHLPGCPARRYHLLTNG